MDSGLPEKVSVCCFHNRSFVSTVNDGLCGVDPDIRGMDIYPSNISPNYHYVYVNTC